MGRRERPRLGLAAGLLAAAFVVTLDAAAGDELVITTALILAPFLAALLGSPRETTFVAVLAIALAAISGVWNHDFGEANYLVRLAIVVAGSAVALVASGGRARETTTRERLGILTEAARVVDDTLTLEEAVERLSNLIVPGFADISVFDLRLGTGLQRLKVQVGDVRAPGLEELLYQRAPGTDTVMSETLESGSVRLIATTCCHPPKPARSRSVHSREALPSPFLYALEGVAWGCSRWW
jgi:hypothetical protein